MQSEVIHGGSALQVEENINLRLTPPLVSSLLIDMIRIYPRAEFILKAGVKDSSNEGRDRARQETRCVEYYDPGSSRSHARPLLYFSLLFGHIYIYSHHWFYPPVCPTSTTPTSPIQNNLLWLAEIYISLPN